MKNVSVINKEIIIHSEFLCVNTAYAFIKYPMFVNGSRSRYFACTCASLFPFRVNVYTEFGFKAWRLYVYVYCSCKYYSVRKRIQVRVVT